MPFVYFIHEDGNDNVFKIGKTSIHPADRCIQLQTGNPRRLVIYRWIETPDYSAIEENLHTQYAQVHIRGEWFHIDRTEVDTACAMIVSMYITAKVSDDYPKWTEDDIIAVQEQRVVDGVYRGGRSPRTARKKNKEYWAAKNQPTGFSDD